MEAVLHNMPTQVPLWSAALGGNADWSAIYDGFESVARHGERHDRQDRVSRRGLSPSQRPLRVLGSRNRQDLSRKVVLSQRRSSLLARGRDRVVASQLKRATRAVSERQLQTRSRFNVYAT